MHILCIYHAILVSHTYTGGSVVFKTVPSEKIFDQILGNDRETNMYTIDVSSDGFVKKNVYAAARTVALVRERTIPTERLPVFLAKLVPSSADRGCRVVSATEEDNARGYSNEERCVLCGPRPDVVSWTSLDPEGPATGQLDQGFPWFSSVPEQMLSWYPNSTLHCMLLMQASQWGRQKFRLNVHFLMSN
jgi:hypothetical protein